MIKRVNFTGRKRIPQSCVDIEVYDGQPRPFDAVINLDNVQLLPGAAVVLEAMCAGSNVVERYEFGEVGKIQPPPHPKLKEVEGENVFFTLKVVDRTERFGRIIGLAEHIRPQRAGKQTAAGRRGILPIDKQDLGQEIWRLDFGPHDVTLLVNDAIPGLADRARSDPLFYAAVYPEVVRSILTRAIAEGGDIEEDDDSWPTLWLRFAKKLHPGQESPPSKDDLPDVRDEWIDEVVAAFCERHELRDKYLVAQASETGDTT